MRVKRGFAGRRKHKRMLKLAEGLKGRRGTCFKLAKRSVQKALKYAYRDRKVKKREFRALWIMRINAACRMNGITYSQFIYGLQKSKVEMDRKMLADLAVHDSNGFAVLTQTARAAIAA